MAKIKKELDYVRGDKVKIEPINWLWPNRIPKGMLSIFAGIGGVSKSTLSLYMAAQITTGRPFIDESTTSRKPGDVIILSAEDIPGKIIIPRLIAMDANISRIFIIKGSKVTLPDGTIGFVGIDDLSKGGDLNLLDDMIKHCPNPQLAIVDPYTAYMGQADSNDNIKVRSFLRPLSEMASDHNLAILGITHLNKNQDLAADFRILGSVGQQNAARMVWLVAQDPDDFDRRLMVWYKGNLAPRTDGLAYRLLNTPITTSDGRTSYQPACCFEKDPIFLTADELLAPRKRSQGRPRKQTEASEWLESFLSDGGLDSKLIIEEGEHLGYSKRTLERAKKSLGILGIPIKNHTAKIVRWEWRLP